jgi:hypothetical protein
MEAGRVRGGGKKHLFHVRFGCVIPAIYGADYLRTPIQGVVSPYRWSLQTFYFRCLAKNETLRGLWLCSARLYADPRRFLFSPEHRNTLLATARRLASAGPRRPTEKAWHRLPSVLYASLRATRLSYAMWLKKVPVSARRSASTPWRLRQQWKYS